VDGRRLTGEVSFNSDGLDLKAGRGVDGALS
jgi:hypothetical protein